MKLLRLLLQVIAFAAFITSIESKKKSKATQGKNNSIELFTTKELDSSHLIRNILVVSGIPFSEVRFRKDSENQSMFFDDIEKAGYVRPSLPMISDVKRNARYISTDEAIISYIIISYNRKLFSNNVLEYAISIQLSTMVRNYINKVVTVIHSSKSMACTGILKIDNMHSTLKTLDKAYSLSKHKLLYGDKPTYIDLIVYTMTLFIENLCLGCVVTRFSNIRMAAIAISSIPQITRFENSSYFRSLIVPGTGALAKRIDFLADSSDLAFMTS